jgi:hypothetical protein
MCAAKLDRERLDPLRERVFGIDYKRIAPRHFVARSVAGLTGGVRWRTGAAALLLWLMRKASGRPWMTAAFHGRVTRFRVVSLADDAPVDRERVAGMSETLAAAGFAPVLDRVVESATPPVWQRLFVDTQRRLYATVGLVPGAPEGEIAVLAPLNDGGFAVAADAPLPLVTDPLGRRAAMPGSDPAALAEAAITLADGADQAPFGLREFLVESLNADERAFDAAVAAGRLRRLKRRRGGGYVEEGIIPSCAAHPAARATRECLVCGKPLCEVCVRHAPDGDYCAGHYPETAPPPGVPAVDLTGDVRPAGPFIRLALALIEPASLVALLTALFPVDGPPGSRIAYVATAVVFFIGWFAWSQARWGATPLGRLAGVAMIDADGGAVGWAAALVKTGGLALTLFTLVPVVGFLPVFAGRRSWTDRIAGVVVVTVAPQRKEVIGAAALGALLLLGVWRHDLLLGVVETVFERAVGGMTGGDRVTLAPVWSVGVDTPPVVDGERVLIARDGTVAAVGLADRGLVWMNEWPGADRLYDDPFVRRFIVAGASGWLRWVDRREGRVFGLAETGGFTTLAVTRTGAVVADGARMAAYDREGRRLWESPIPATALRSYRDFLFAVTADGVAVVDDRTGAVAKRLPGWRMAGPLDETGVLLTGKGRVARYSLATGTIVWEASGEKGSGPFAGPALALADRAIDPADGKPLFAYPAGCRFVGRGIGALVLDCGEETRLVNDRSGALAGTIPLRRVTSVIAAGPKLLALVACLSDGRYRVTLAPADRAGRPGPLRPVGSFATRPTAIFSTGPGRLFVATGESAGVYADPGG